MHDQQTIGRFVQLRAEGRAFNQIAAALNVGKRTLIRWSRQCHCEIQNLRAIESEAQLAPLLDLILIPLCFPLSKTRISDRAFRFSTNGTVHGQVPFSNRRNPLPISYLSKPAPFKKFIFVPFVPVSICHLPFAISPITHHASRITHHTSLLCDLCASAVQNNQ